MLTVPHSSSSSDCSCCPAGTGWIFARLKILIFDLGPLLFDVGSDIFNGKTFIDDGNPIWGAVIISVIFIPMTVWYVVFAISEYRAKDSSRRKKLLILLFAPILAVPAIPIMTVCYIVYVLYVLTRKFVQPSYDDDDGDNNTKAGNFLLLEAVGEANLQAVLVTSVTLVIGLSSNSFSQFIQIGGILVSLFSVAKTCCEWHLKALDDNKDPEITTTIKALLFFAPHVVWRTTATAFVLAFLKFYSLIPLAVHIFVCIGITTFLHQRQADSSFVSFALSLFTPSVADASNKFNRSLLKATMLTSTLILLPSLIFIRLLPFLPPDTVLCTLGLSHLDLGSNSTVPSCSPCFNTTAVSTGTPCVMATTMDDFSNWFIPLIILGSWCLFEEIVILCKRFKGLPLLWCLFEEIAILCKGPPPTLFPDDGQTA